MKVYHRMPLLVLGVMILMVSIAGAYVYSGNWRDGNNGIRKVTLSYDLWHDPQYGAYKNAIQTAARSWNGMHVRVNIYSVVQGTPGEDIHIQLISGSPQPGHRFGQALFFQRRSWPLRPLNVNPETGASWDYVQIEMYQSAIEYQIQNNGVSNNLRQKVAAHEIGHALGLADITNQSIEAVMRQGVVYASNGSLIFAPRQADRQHLYVKYGY